MQLAIIKKKQCDAKALTIVEQLLESHVNPDWLLQNVSAPTNIVSVFEQFRSNNNISVIYHDLLLLQLEFINKSHMEDVIEERAIVKLCGYILCSNQLTVIIRQQYHISTRKNKVYDISRRKNFCSSLCYGAANFLLEQMLESPLWLREKEDIPTFQILPLNSRSTCGDEIDVVGVNFSRNMNADNSVNDGNKKSTELVTIKQMKRDVACNMTSPEKEIICNSHLLNNVAAEKDGKIEETAVNTNSQRLFNCETHSLELSINQESKNCDSKEFTNCESNYDNNIQQIDVSLENLEIKTTGQSENILHLHKHNRDTENKNNTDISDNDEMLQPQLDEISNNENDTRERLQPQSMEISNDKNDKNKTKLEPHLDEINNSLKDEKMIQSQLDKMYSSNNTMISSACSEYRKARETNKIKNKKYKSKKTNDAEVQNIYLKLAMHVEQSVREWVTKNTLCLLMGEVDERNQLLDKLTQHDRYQQLCKKLNKLQLEDEKEDRVDLEKNKLKSLPHFSVLQEDGKKMELKVQ